MAVKVAINGFGRIGRLAFRQMFGAEGFEIVAINDLTSPEMLAHLLKYDSTQGKYALADKVSFDENSITVDGKKITIYAEAKAADLPWGQLGVDVVLECTGFYTSKDKVLSTLSFPLLQETIFLLSYTTLTTSHLPLRTRSSLQHPAPPTALHLWQRLLTIMHLSSPVSCAQSTLTQVIR